jgi:uncharacterized membrane protein YhaH (DUF805 family)
MDFFQAIGSSLSKYATFSGRACRSEYWFFRLFLFIINFVGGMLDKTVLQDYSYAYTIGHHVQHAGLLSMILMVVFFLPSMAVDFRRLHDVDRSAWWLLIALTLIGALFPLLYWYCSRGTTGDNRFGPDPLAGKQ